MANGKGQLPEQIWLESQPKLLDSTFVKASIARTRGEDPNCITSKLKQMLQYRSSYLIEETGNDQRALGTVGSRGSSARFRMNMSIFGTTSLLSLPELHGRNHRFASLRFSPPLSASFSTKPQFLF